MSRQRIYTASLVTLLSGLTCCVSSPVNTVTPLNMSSAKAADEPCWIRSPDCRADAENATLYFVGQSKEPLASWGRPSRDSIHSAQRDAEQEYARYLGVDIEASSYLQSLFSNEHYQMQFEESISENVNHTVSELIKADEYSVAHQESSDGEPLWSVYVLIKISKDSATKHQAAIAEELRRRAAAPPPPDEWVASVFNIDDTVAIYVNDKKINQCDFSRSCEINLSPHFESGHNKVRLEYSNHALFWTYGYEVLKNGEVMYKGRCGQVWVMGCGLVDTKLGVVHTFEFEVDKPLSLLP